MTDKSEDLSDRVAVAAFRADVNAGLAMSKADSAANVADAVLTMQAVILDGLVSAGVVDARKMSDHLESQFNSLTAEEKAGAMGHCLSLVLRTLSTGAARKPN